MGTEHVDGVRGWRCGLPLEGEAEGREEMRAESACLAEHSRFFVSFSTSFCYACS